MCASDGNEGAVDARPSGSFREAANPDIKVILDQVPYKTITAKPAGDGWQAARRPIMARVTDLGGHAEYLSRPHAATSRTPAILAR